MSSKCRRSPLGLPWFPTAAAGWSWSARPTPAACCHGWAWAARTAPPFAPPRARCDWTAPLAARPPTPTGPDFGLQEHSAPKHRRVTMLRWRWWWGVWHRLRTIAELIWVVQACVFAAVFEGRVQEVFAGSPGAGGQQGGVEKRRLVVQCHATTVHDVCRSAIHPTVTLEGRKKTSFRSRPFECPVKQTWLIQFIFKPSMKIWKAVQVATFDMDRIIYLWTTLSNKGTWSVFLKNLVIFRFLSLVRLRSSLHSDYHSSVGTWEDCECCHFTKSKSNSHLLLIAPNF